VAKLEEVTAPYPSTITSSNFIERASGSSREVGHPAISRLELGSGFRLLRGCEELSGRGGIPIEARHRAVRSSAAAGDEWPSTKAQIARFRRPLLNRLVKL